MDTLKALKDKRNAVIGSMRAIVNAAEAANRDLTPQEKMKYSDGEAQLEQIDARMTRLEAIEREERGATRATALFGARASRGLGIYGDGGASYFKDLVRWRLHADQAAGARLAQHAAETPAIYADINRTDGSGGEFVPPGWMIERYAEFARQGRVIANLCSRFDLPPGVDSIETPRITTGPQAAMQTADNAAVQETDLVSTSFSAPVRTIAGQQDVSIQLLEQSPVATDEIIFKELMADADRVLDAQMISGSNASGQLQGILGLSGINAITYTDASPTLPELYPKIADAIQQVIINRLLPPEAIVMHPRRWVWALASLDSNSRPLVVPTAAGPNNAPATAGMLNLGTPVGTMLGLPVYLDANIPTNLGAGTNEDRILVGRFSDAHFYEGTLRTRVLPDVGSNTLTVRLQVYQYAAYAVGRFPKSFSVISGTGLVTPTL